MYYKGHLFDESGAPRHIRIVEDGPGTLAPITVQFLRAGQAPGYKTDDGRPLFKGRAVFCEVLLSGAVTCFQEADLNSFALRGRRVQWAELEPRTRNGILNLYCALWETTAN